MAKAGRGDDQYMVRFPDGMRDRIKREAERNGRSMNAEIVSALEEKYPAPRLTHQLFFDFLDDLERQAIAGVGVPDDLKSIRRMRDLISRNDLGVSVSIDLKSPGKVIMNVTNEDGSVVTHVADDVDR